MEAKILYLRELVEQQKWPDVLRVAEQLVFGGGLSVAELAEVNYAVCLARVHQNDFFAAIPPGTLARKLAVDTGLWDLVANITITLSAAYLFTRQYEQTLITAYDFFDYLPRSGVARQREGDAWWNIARALHELDRTAEALRAYHRAATCVRRQENLEKVFYICRWALECLYAVDPDAVPAALREQKALASAFPNNAEVTAWMRHDLARYAYFRQRYRVAARWALQALALTNSGFMRTHALMLLARVHRAANEPRQALGYALAARQTAIREKLFALEYEVAELVYELIRHTAGTALAGLDREMLAQGLDITPLVGEPHLGERRSLS